MLALLTGWIPIIGPIVNGIVSVWTKKQDTDLAKLQVESTAAVENAKTSANIIETTKDDIGVRVMRDLICFPVAVWAGLIGWDTVVSYNWPNWMFHVNNYPDSVGYIPYAVMVFLLGNIGINAWKSK